MHVRRQLVDAGLPDVAADRDRVAPLLGDGEDVDLVAGLQRHPLPLLVQQLGHVDIEQRSHHAGPSLLRRQDPVDLHPAQVGLRLDAARQLQQPAQALALLDLVDRRAHDVAVDLDPA